MIASTPVEAEITFEAAIAKTEDLLESIAQEQVHPDQVGDEIAQLVTSVNGARGFFVTYLPDPRSFSDLAYPSVVAALAQSPDVVSEVLVKTLAMSAAMAITHRRNQDETNAQGSDQVLRRTTQLIQKLPKPMFSDKIAALSETLKTGSGDYQAFLERWQYDSEQRSAIATALAPWHTA